MASTWFNRQSHRLRMRLEMLFRRERATQRLEDEMSFHLEEQVRENMAAGMPADEARFAALRAFGNPVGVGDRAQQSWSWNWLESLARDVRIAGRTLWRSPGFALTAMLVMAIGIGANVAMFSVVHSVLLKPLPYDRPEQLVALYNYSGNDANFHMPVDAGSYFEWKAATGKLADLALVTPFQQYNLSADNGMLPETIGAAYCSANFFSLLKVQPVIGRLFADADDRREAEATVVLSAPLWRRRYHGNPGILGKKIHLNARPYTVIGVLPESFVWTNFFSGNKVQLWTAVNHEASPSLLATFEDHEFLPIARLHTGVSMAALVNQIDTVQKRVKLEHPDPSTRSGGSGVSMLDDTVAQYRTPLYALLAATGCVLLIACLNVASLLVARSAARRKEVAIRSALGVTRMRLFRKRLLESLLLTSAGGLTGVFLAWAALRWLVSARQNLHRVESIHLDGVALLFALGITLLCALVACVISATGIGGERVLGALGDSSRSHSAGHARAGLRKTLLVLEVGLTMILLVGAGLLLKSYQRLRATDMGIPTENVLTMHFSLPDVRYKEPEKVIAFYESLLERVRATPGVRSAGLVSTAPGQGWGGDNLVDVVEHPPLPKGVDMDLMRHGADPGYFQAAQLPLLRGRTFTPEERLKRANVIVLSELAAKLCFPNEDPIGKHVRVIISNEKFEVIGVVGDVRWHAAEKMRPTYYLPIFGNGYTSSTLLIRSDRDVEALALPVQKIFSSMDSDLPLSDIMTMEQTVGETASDARFHSLLVLSFAIVALVLAATGLYGVLAYLVTQRTTEIGIRIALGSSREAVLRRVLLDGLRPAMLGLLLGIGGSIAAVRGMESMLYNTKANDGGVFVAVSVTILVVAAVACAVPAWRASRLDPMHALRTE